MSFVPSPMQKEVIGHRKGSLLVAAAAGSGKTTTLIAHVLDRLKEKDPEKRSDLRRMIIVTYTNAAASEMRAKLIGELRKALEADSGSAWLRLQSEIAPQAHICTVDSLCGFLVRNYFDKIDVSPDIRIADNAELLLLKDDVLDALLEEKYTAGDERDLLDLLTDYSSEKGDKTVRDMVKKLYDTAQNALYPDDWLKDAEKPQPEDEEAFWQQEWIAAAYGNLREKLEAVRGRITALQQETEQSEAPQKDRFKSMFQNDLALLDGILAQDFAGMRQTLSGIVKFGPKPQLVKGKIYLDEELDKRIADTRNKKIKPEIAKLQGLYGRPSATHVEEVRMAQKPKKALIRLTGEFAARFREEMKSRNIADFIDIEHYALGLLIEKAGDGTVTRTDLAKQLAAEFDEIIIDEYQDINNVQDALLWALSGEEDGRPNRFMVGDVKQSIYRFRRANPEIFLHKYRTFSDAKDAVCRRIDLSANYRSRREIVDGVNDLFRRIMDEPFGGIVYDERAQLNFGATGFDENGHVPEILLCESVGTAAEDRAAEAARIGRKILELLENGVLNDGSPDKTRKVERKDIQILMRTMKDARIYVETLMEMGIPAAAPLKHGFYDTEEVQTVLALLRVIDNPRQDIPLAAVLVSPFGGFDDSALADIVGFAKKEAPEAEGLYERLLAARDLAPDRFGRVGFFLEQLDRWRDQAEVSSIPELIHSLMTESGYELYLRAMPGGMSRLANLEALLDKAEAYEKSSYRGLFQFNRYMESVIDRIRDGTDEGESAPVQDDDDVVHIDTIHSSKGLQYPVVFLADASREFNLMDATGSVLIHEKEGVVLESRDRETRLKIKNLRKTYAVDLIREELKAEQLRLLYVAMTRAEEYLFISGTAKDARHWRDKYAHLKGNGGPLPSYALKAGDSYMDWILMAAAAGTPHLRMMPETVQELAEHEKRTLRSALSLEQLRQRMEAIRNDPPEIGEALDKRVHFRYPYEALAGVRGIYTVSALKQKAQEDMQAEEQEEQPEELPSVRKESEAAPRYEAAGRSTVTGAERGTVYHKIMEHLEIAKLTDEASVDVQIAGMKDRGLLTEEEAAAVPAAEILAFFETPLGARVRRADAEGKLFREQPFILGVPLSEIDPAHADSSERVLVQGIIDLYFEEDGKLILADYKTDCVAEMSELEGRYRTQLEYYRRALEQASAKPVARTLIYSTVLRSFRDIR
ncbi:MAG: helicase-exonuclease AddAB subunit AddA [Lachnospiraceae bacterium]|nr:helicase-exonuclease AddAB subunit AddA [Lachnospiraceae bacterium]